MTGLPFDILPEELALRKKLGVEGSPQFHPVFRFMQLGAFWQHWNLFKRKCDKTGQQIISVFSEDCPYPVWHKDEWIKNADPPGADFIEGQPVFPQLWDFFRRSPIAHNMGAGNENCEYTDDVWYSKNCYLFHSALECEDCRYCYRTIKGKDSMYAAFGFQCERTFDLVYSHSCFNVLFVLSCWDCRDSAFLYDCRGCSHCFLCSNMRNAQYCFGNEQLSKEAYEAKVREWDLSSQKMYGRAKQAFQSMLRERAWHRASFIERSDRSTGNYIDHSKNAQNCYFVDDTEDSINVMRTTGCKDCLDSISPAVNVQLVYYSCTVQDQCYDVQYGYNLGQCKWMEYCAHCFQCQHCFGCCGLTGKKYYIFNKPFAEADYEREKQRIIDSMKSTGEYGKFFPGFFAANPYDESISGFYWPLDVESAKKYGFRLSAKTPVRPSVALDVSGIPDLSDQAQTSLSKETFWDEKAKRPFQIQAADMTFAQEIGAPLPTSFYARRLQENFRMVPFNGMLRKASCGKCQKEVQTSWPGEFDGRIVCEDCYLKEVY